MNYGGILQNWALQQALLRMGHEPITIDAYERFSTPHYIFSCMKTAWMRCRGKKWWRYPNRYHGTMRSATTGRFIEQNIIKTKVMWNYKRSVVRRYRLNALITGSDQVWRQVYGGDHLEDMYLRFASGLDVKRVAYAASFGVDEWEYTPKQTYECSKLAKKFDAISVREESGIKLCDDNLGVCATWVLDPTLLLKKEDYLEVCKDVPFSTEKILVAYVLDMSESVSELCKSVAKERGLVIKMLRADFGSVLSVPEWLAMFRDASYVVTDSFHGTIFSIIFGKDFKSIYNKKRGAARFESLLNLYNSGRLEEMRNFSINWLKKALEK